MSTATRAKSEVESVECVLEVVMTLNEKRDVRQVLFLTEFAKKQQRQLRYPCLKQPHHLVSTDD